jgi:exopolysaccharide biosynthesis predicted pyruvyltransferase EpsI
VARSWRHSLPLLCADVSKLRFEVFVETIRAAHEVHTDRLHVMLFAAMLGKKVYAYPTSHGKLEGVYRHSRRRLGGRKPGHYVSRRGAV